MDINWENTTNVKKLWTRSDSQTVQCVLRVYGRKACEKEYELDGFVRH